VYDASKRDPGDTYHSRTQGASGEYGQIIQKSKAWVVSRALQLYLEDLEDVEVADSRVMDTSDEILSVDEFHKRHGL